MNAVLSGAIGAALMAVVAVIAGVIYRRRADARARALSTTDALTGLRNRRYVEQSADSDASACLRRHAKWGLINQTPQESDLVFLLVDLDEFKRVNDKFGHPAGDRLLVEIAHALVASCRDSDVVARWGGDEFLVIARFTTGTEAKRIAERIRRAVASRAIQMPQGQSVGTTCSVGYGVFPFDAKRSSLTWRHVLTLADHASYDAKNSGRNRCVGYVAGQSALRGVETPEISRADAEGWLQGGKLKRELVERVRASSADAAVRD